MCVCVCFVCLFVFACRVISDFILDILSIVISDPVTVLWRVLICLFVLADTYQFRWQVVSLSVGGGSNISSVYKALLCSLDLPCIVPLSDSLGLGQWFIS